MNSYLMCVQNGAHPRKNTLDDEGVAVFFNLRCDYLQSTAKMGPRRR